MVSPFRHGRPNVSEMITGTSVCPRSTSPRRIAAADADESIGSRQTAPSLTFDWSIPAFAQTQPCFVSDRISPFVIRTIRFDSRSTSSTARASRSQASAHSLAKSPAVTVSSCTTRPSALDTIFCVTTSTSPASSGVSCASSAPAISPAKSSPSRTSGMPPTAKTRYSAGAATISLPSLRRCRPSAPPPAPCSACSSR